VRIVALALTLVLLAACGGGGEVVTSGDPRPSQPAPSPGGQRYTVTTTVLESPEHGPQLCFGVEDSYPPQCSGPDVVGWDWDAAPSRESANGTTWGEYSLVGTWDGAAFTLTEPPAAPTWPDEAPDDDGRFATPCPAPDGGWAVVDPETATDAAMQAAIEYADAQPDVGAVWLDQSTNPASRQEPPDEAAMNDPARLVLNITFTGDLERHAQAIRERWGGALCVSEATVARSELERIRTEVQDELADRFVASWTDDIRGQVHLSVVVDDGMQQQVDERYGAGVVVIEAALRPVER